MAARKKLTPEDEEKVKAMLADGQTVKATAKEFGVSISVIGRIKDSEAWRRNNKWRSFRCNDTEETRRICLNCKLSDCPGWCAKLAEALM